MRCWVGQYHHHWSLFPSICAWVHELKVSTHPYLGLWSKWKWYLMVYPCGIYMNSCNLDPLLLYQTVRDCPNSGDILKTWWFYCNICLKQYFPITSWYFQNIVRNWKCGEKLQEIQNKKGKSRYLKVFLTVIYILFIYYYI